MTFNLRDDQPQDSPNSWEKRRDLCVSVITSYSPMILCTQQGFISCFFLPFFFLINCNVNLMRIRILILIWVLLDKRLLLWVFCDWDFGSFWITLWNGFNIYYSFWRFLLCRLLYFFFACVFPQMFDLIWVDSLFFVSGLSVLVAFIWLNVLYSFMCFNLIPWYRSEIAIGFSWAGFAR